MPRPLARSLRAAALVLVTLLLALGAAPAAFGQAVPPTPPGAPAGPGPGGPPTDRTAAVSPGASTQSAAQVAGYWTTENIASAEALLPTRAGGPTPPSRAPSQAPGASGPAGAIEPAAPQGRAAQRPAGAGAQSLLGVPQPQFPPFNRNYPYPPPYTRHEVFTESGNYGYPYSVNGTLFFTLGARNFRCSATAVNAENGSVVWTAGHCVNGGGAGGRPGDWATNVAFLPGYKDGAAPHGVWTARMLWSDVGWVFNGELEYDLGAVVVNRAPAGARLIDVVGAAGIVWNVSRLQHWHDFGYPAAPPFSGNRQYLCTASHAADDQPSGAPVGPPTVALGCDMTGGSSGGSWQVAFGRDSLGAAGYVNSVNSYKYIQPAMPEEMYGPYHGDAAANLYDAVRNR